MTAEGADSLGFASYSDNAKNPALKPFLMQV